MRVHQKFLPVRAAGGLLPHFIAVMDNAVDPRGFIAKGNEWVLNARLADARFFFRRGLPGNPGVAPPGARAPDVPGPPRKLRRQDRAARGAFRGDRRGGRAPRDRVRRPRGGAALEGGPRRRGWSGSSPTSRESWAVSTPAPKASPNRCGRRSTTSTARREPRTTCRRSETGAILSLADRFDTAGRPLPRGSPPDRIPRSVRAAPRRRRRRRDRGLAPAGASTGRPIARKALDLYPPDLEGLAADAALAELETFFGDRLRNHLERAGSSYDEVSAVVNVGLWDFADAAERASALTEARQRLDFRSLVLAFKRIRNILGEPRPPASPRRSSTGRTRSARSPPIFWRRRGSSEISLPSGTTRGAGDDRLDRPVSRPLLRRRARERAGGGPETKPSRAALRHPAGVHEDRGLF